MDHFSMIANCRKWITFRISNSVGREHASEGVEEQLEIGQGQGFGQEANGDGLLDGGFHAGLQLGEEIERSTEGPVAPRGVVDAPELYESITSTPALFAYIVSSATQEKAKVVTM